MLKVVEEFKDKGVAFLVVYTREPHAGQKFMGYDFSDKEQTKTHDERVENAKELIDKHGEARTILIDEFGDKSVQKTVGGGRPNSLVVVDKDGNVALWQGWSNAEQLRTKLAEMTSAAGAAGASAPSSDGNDDGEESGSTETGSTETGD